jgi:beta-N-acetylhexosaminidase
VADATGTLLNQLLEHGAGKTVVFAMGNPYVVADFPKIDNYLCTFSNETVSEISAVKALFGEIPVHGHLPVSIPNVAQRGAGIERQAQGDSQHAHKMASQ